MTKLQWVAVGVIAFVSVGEIRAEEKKPNHAKLIIGVWEVEPKGGDAKAPRILIEFTKDGKVKMTFKGKGKDLTLEGTYKIVGDKLETAIKGPTNVNKETLTINKMTEKELSATDSDGADLLLIRVKQ